MPLFPLYDRKFGTGILSPVTSNILSPIITPSDNPIPPLPPFDNIAACWGLFNFNPIGYDASAGVSISGTDTSVVGLSPDAPYPLRWANVTDAGDPPYLVNTWDDQNGNANDLTQVGAAQPLLDATNQLISFDGTQWLVSGGNSFGTQTLTAYALFRAENLVGTGYLFAIGREGVNDGAFTAKMVAGVLTVSVTAATTHLLNTKIKTIADNNWHLLTVIIDTTVVDPTAQVIVLLDNSAAGVSAPLSTDLGGNSVDGVDPLFVASRNSGLNAIACDYRMIRIQADADDLVAATAMWTYIQYLQTQSP